MLRVIQIQSNKKFQFIFHIYVSIYAKFEIYFCHECKTTNKNYSKKGLI